MNAPGWRGQLQLRYRRVGERTVVHDLHQGPLRVLQPLYPEGGAICHQVLVHPPGGVVGGDELLIDAELASGTHALITTPGATRFYRSEGRPSLQQTRLHVAADARLEWLPLETIVYPGCEAESRLTLDLAPGAEMMGWETLVLGLPAAGQPFDRGWFQQHIEWPGHWLERGRLAAADAALMQSPLGFGGRKVLATAWLAAGAGWAPARRDALLDAAREALATHPLAATAGITAAQRTLLVLRVLADGVEPAMQLLAAVRAAWRREAWGLAALPPRIWAT